MYHETIGDTIKIFADNSDPFPVTFIFDKQPELENMKTLNNFELQMLIPAYIKRFLITDIIIKDKNKSYKYSIGKYNIFIGNTNQNKFDSTYVYDLPFKKGKNFHVTQGYNGLKSHQNIFALDFNLPEGTEVTAAREGTIIMMNMGSNHGCPTIKCQEEANGILVLHPDGSIAKYGHLKFNSAKVSKGDKIEKGQTLALSGNTGWSSGPHLHFETYLPTDNISQLEKSVKTLFKVGDGKNAEYLKEKANYTKNY